MNLNLLSPIYLLGILGVSLPILIHMLTRRRKTHIKFSAVYLLFQAKSRSVKRAQPNRLLLLLFRCMAIIFLCLALSNPLFTFGGPREFLASGPSANIFILDDSYSMRYRGKEKTVFETAVQVLGSMAAKFPANTFFSVVMASRPAKIEQDWTADRNQIKSLLKTLTPSYQTTDIGQAIAKASELLESAPHGVKRIYILTDKDKNGWAEMETLPAEYQASVQIKVIDFSGIKNGDNQALVKNVEVTQEFLTNNGIIRIKAEVVNLMADRAVSKLPVSLWINGRMESESVVDLPPGGTAEKEFSYPYTDNEPLAGFIEIQDDALAADNRRMFSYQPDQRVRVLVVDGDPRAIAHQSETFYVERALNPFAVSMSDIEPTISTLAELPQRRLELFSVVMLSNVQELPFDYERKLENFVLRGGALFISLGDQVDAKFYNEKMGTLLPVTLKALNQVSFKDEPYRFLAKPSAHPVLKIFTGKALKEMGDIRFNSIYSVEPREGAEYTVPMKFANGFPAVIESGFGKGKVILFVSSVDRDWNSFPIQPTFLPWIQRWIKYSARSLENITKRKFLIGESFELETENIHYLNTPSGTVKRIRMSEPGKINFTDTFRPGVYSLFRTNEAPAEVEPDQTQTLPLDAERAGSFTVNVDTLESSPGKISDQEIKDFFPGLSVEITADLENWQSPSETQGFPLAAPFLAFMALALFAEGFTVRNE